MPCRMRPDKSHVMIEHLPGADVVLALPEPGHESTWRTKENVQALVAQYQQKGVSVMGSDRRTLLAKGHTAETVTKNVIDTMRAFGVVA
jgi:hypothetical protein